MREFDEEVASMHAAELADWKQLSFMAYCCERMLPNYRSFQRESDFGDVGVLRSALDSVWHWAEGGTRPQDIASVAASCVEQAPDTELFSSPYTSAALDAAAAVALTVQAMLTPSAQALLDVAQLSRDTIDLHVQRAGNLSPDDPLFETKILASDSMQAELRTQFESLMLLRVLDGDRSSIAKGLRAQWALLDKGSTEG